MVRVYYDTDCNMDLLRGKTVAAIGYRSQGHVYALNLEDSGVSVVVGPRPGSKSRVKAEEAGLAVLDTVEATKAGDAIIILTSDQDQPDIYKKDTEPNLREGNMLMFVHGFSIHFNQIVTPTGVDATVCAPKGPGHIIHGQCQEGRGTPPLVVVHRDASGKAHGCALTYTGGIGVGHVRITETTFREETETDLFGGRAILYGGICELIQTGFGTLAEAGYGSEVAYFGCIHEAKLIVDLINSGDFAMMRYSISDTAEYGDCVIGKCLITEETRKEMKEVLTEIQDGTFAGNWATEDKTVGRSHFLTMRRVHAAHLSEKAGEKLRKMTSWPKK